MEEVVEGGSAPEEASKDEIQDAVNKKNKKNMTLEFKNKSAKPDSQAKLLKKANKKKTPSREATPEPTESPTEYFGIRSYIHHFYESVAVKNPQLYEEIYDEELQLGSQARKRKKANIWWRLSLAIGGITLVLGVMFLFVGYLTPPHKVITGYHEDIQIIDKAASNFNHNIKLCRIIGLIMFCSGGCIFCTVLLLSILGNVQYDEEDDRDSPEPFCLTITTEEPPQSPTDKKIPATEELTNVQPKRDGAEVVMTKSGLCKPPGLMAAE